jgi:putative oxidoreductase
MAGYERGNLQSDLAILILRLSAGLMMAFSHGLGKITKNFSGEEIQFADPIGLGPSLSLLLAGSAEFFCALAVAVGFYTRWSAIPVAFTMAVAAFVVHADDPFQKQEFALIYFFVFLYFAMVKPGKFSVDAVLNKKRG